MADNQITSSASAYPETGMQIKVHGINSRNVRKVVIALEELGLDYALMDVGVFEGEQFSPTFRVLNPWCKVPVIEDPLLGQPLAESGAILLWLAERAASTLLPITQPARAEVMQWLMMQMSAVGPLLGQYNHFQLLGEDAEAYAFGRFKEQAHRIYRVLDDRLVDRDWIAGDGYSIADIALWPWSTYLEQHGFDPDMHGALVRWRSQVGARPAVIRAQTRMEAAFAPLSPERRLQAAPDDLDRFFGRTVTMPQTDFTKLTR